MFCSSCGADNKDRADFCAECGKPVRQGEPYSSRGQPIPPQHQPAGARPGHVPNYLVQAILVTIFCCLPFGIVAIVFAAQVNGKLERGDHEGALRASSAAKLWTWISFGVSLGFVGVWLLFSILLGLTGSLL